MLPQEHLEDGQKKENLDVLDQTQVKEEEKESITSKMSKKYLESKTNDLQMTQSQCVTQELVPVTKKKILKEYRYLFISCSISILCPQFYPPLF